MKKVITAIGNSMLNEKCKENKNCEVLCDDINNDEKLLEILEREKIDVLFISNPIIQSYNVEELFKIIRKMNQEVLIVFFNIDNLDFERDRSQNIKIFENFEIEKEELDAILNSPEESLENKGKIISIFGARGIGKSTFSTFFAKNVDKSKVKTLLIDFDLYENSIRTILKIKKQPKFTGEITDLIINKEKNLDILCDLDLFFPKTEKIDFFKIHEILNNLRKEYDLIIIDTSSDFQNECTKRIFYNSDDVIFLMEPNILGIKKAKNIIEVLQNDWKVNDSKIKMIINKSNIYQISESIIEEIFPGIKICGKIKYNDAYNLMINRSVDKKEIVKEYVRICERIVGRTF